MDDGIFYIVCCSQEHDGGVAAVRRGSCGGYEVCRFTELAGANYLVAAADGRLRVTELQLEGKKRMSAESFLLGNKPEAGQSLGQ